MSNRKAFTLIELLVVVAIISLLVSILLPSLSKAKELAKQTSCLMQLRSMGLAEQYYHSENKGQIVYTRADGFTPHCTYWVSYLWSITEGNLEQIRNSGNPVEAEGFRCPSAADTDGWNDVLRDGTQYLQGITYARNSFNTSEVLWWIHGNSSYQYPGVSIYDIESPGNTADIADGLYIHAPHEDIYWDEVSAPRPDGLRATSYRHGDGDTLSLLLWDGHAESVRDSVSEKFSLTLD